MRGLWLALAALIASPVSAQVSNPPDLSEIKASIATAQSTANQANTTAQTAVASNVKTVNGKSPVNGDVTLNIPAATDTSAFVKSINGMTPSNGVLSLTIPTLPDLSPYVKSVNGITPSAGNVTIAIPSIAGLATTSNVTSAISIATAGMVTAVNGITPVSGNVTVPLPVSQTTFVTGFTNASPGTLANLYANAPCSATYVNQFATVVDLYGVVTETMRCTNFGSPFGYGCRARRTYERGCRRVEQHRIRT